ncbi:MAG: hypothetical protein ABW166_01915 [Sedimenticola sp.]
MFLKLLLTLLVIAGALIYVRQRNQPSPPRLPAEPQRSNLVKIAAAVSVTLMLLGAVGYFYFQWQDNYQVVDLRVVDSRSGNETHYQAYKGDVEAREFTTTDGRHVSLAEVERMEVGAGR